jgi:hypothetical protein
MLPNAQVPAFHAARLGPERWALRHGEDVVSWGELDRRSTRRAWALKAAGVIKDDLVTLKSLELFPCLLYFFSFPFAKSFRRSRVNPPARQPLPFSFSTKFRGLGRCPENHDRLA